VPPGFALCSSLLAFSFFLFLSLSLFLFLCLFSFLSPIFSPRTVICGASLMSLRYFDCPSVDHHRGDRLALLSTRQEVRVRAIILRKRFHGFSDTWRRPSWMRTRKERVKGNRMLKESFDRINRASIFNGERFNKLVSIVALEIEMEVLSHIRWD